MNCTKQGHAGVPSVVSTITHAWCRACALDILLPSLDPEGKPSEDNGTVNTLQAALFNLGVDLDRRKALTGEAVHTELVKFFRALGAEDIGACLSYHSQMKEGCPAPAPEALGPDIIQHPLSPYGFLQLVMDKLDTAGYPVIAAMVRDTAQAETSEAKRILYQKLMYVDRGQPVTAVIDLLVTYYCATGQDTTASMLKSAFLPLGATVPEQEVTALVPKGALTMQQRIMLTEGARILRTAVDSLDDRLQNNTAQEVLSILSHKSTGAKWQLFKRLTGTTRVTVRGTTVGPNVRGTLEMARSYLHAINAPHPYIDNYLLGDACNH